MLYLPTRGFSLALLFCGLLWFWLWPLFERWRWPKLMERISPLPCWAWVLLEVALAMSMATTVLLRKNRSLSNYNSGHLLVHSQYITCISEWSPTMHLLLNNNHIGEKFVQLLTTTYTQPEVDSPATILKEFRRQLWWKWKMLPILLNILFTEWNRWLARFDGPKMFIISWQDVASVDLSVRSKVAISYVIQVSIWLRKCCWWAQGHSAFALACMFVNSLWSWTNHILMPWKHHYFGWVEMSNAATVDPLICAIDLNVEVLTSNSGGETFEI